MSVRLQIIDKPGADIVSYWDLAALPAGSMWREPQNDLPDRECWCIVLPNMAGLWRTTERAGGTNNLWGVSGNAPSLTVTPSIDATVRFADGRVEGWHGFITSGEMTP
jgi:hypothetical protein